MMKVNSHDDRACLWVKRQPSGKRAKGMIRLFSWKKLERLEHWFDSSMLPENSRAQLMVLSETLKALGVGYTGRSKGTGEP